MKNTLFILFFLFLSIPSTWAQSQYQKGMKYQAVARNLDGHFMANENLLLKVKLHSLLQEEEAAYIETHKVKTNQIGLFELVIGEGKVEQGIFHNIPWSTEDIFMAIYLKDSKSNQFLELNDSKLMAVPYAFHAITANSLVDPSNSNQRSARGLSPHEVWSTLGNNRLNDAINRLGNTDAVDLVIITNDIERLRVTSDGAFQISVPTEIEADLEVLGNVQLNTRGELTTIGGALNILNGSNTNMSGSLNIDKYLKVGQEADFLSSISVSGIANIRKGLFVGNDASFSANVDISGQLNVNKKFSVLGGAPSVLTGQLRVDGPTILNNEFRVDNNAPSFLSGSLNVTGISNLGAPLTVENQALTHLTGDLIVDGKTSLREGVGLEGKLTLRDTLFVLDQAPAIFTGKVQVSGEATFEENVSLESTLELTSSQSEFLATFENTNGNTGDGLKIKLGKTHGRWMDNPPAGFSNRITAEIPGFGFLDAALEQTITLFKDLMSSPDQTFNASNFEQIGVELADAFVTSSGLSWEDFGSVYCNLTQELISEINTSIALPKRIGGFDIGNLVVGGINDAGPVGDLLIPDALVPEATGKIFAPVVTIPAIPNVSCPALPSLDNFNLPNFSLISVPNSLSSENKFIQFTDKDDRQLGAIEAQSINEWCVDYLDRNFFLNIFNSFAGVTVIGLDPTQIAETAVKYGINGFAQLSNIVDAYNSIGVQYNSGFGDYAEWLERKNANELISAGDIVAVVGGKITKDLSHAEQIMAVSTNPIVLGNKPPENREHLGNKLAFMGQIPVKIMGPVQTGDFIVGKGDIPGYGVAVNPQDMTIDDYNYAVGRAWESFSGDGPKLVNTVVGIHNGDFSNILKRYEFKLQQTDKRLNKIEAQLNQINPIVKN